MGINVSVLLKTSLSFDLKKCRELKVLSEPGELVCIHDEITKAWRFTSTEARELDTDIFHQSIHPFAKRLVGNPVDFKRKKLHTLYKLPFALRALPEAKEFISKEFTSRGFKSNCSLIPIAPPQAHVAARVAPKHKR